MAAFMRPGVGGGRKGGWSTHVKRIRVQPDGFGHDRQIIVLEQPSLERPNAAIDERARKHGAVHLKHVEDGELLRHEWAEQPLEPREAAHRTGRQHLSANYPGASPLHLFLGLEHGWTEGLNFRDLHVDSANFFN